MRTNIYILLLSLIVIILTSCTSQKNLIYFQTENQGAYKHAYSEGSTNFSPNYYLAKEDMLYIDIITHDEETTRMFSLKENRYSQSDNTIYLNSYVIDKNGEYSSQDGEIISRASEAVGLTTVRGSKTRGGAKASLELIRKIKEEDFYGLITIDGPKGPNRVVKKGIIDIARMSGTPIIPAVYWSPQKRFLKFNSWDKFRFPLIGTKLVMLFGDPIPVGENPSEEEVENIRLKIEDDLNRMYKDLKENYYNYLKQ